MTADVRAKEIQLITRDDLVPICPHCEEAISEVFVRSKGFSLWKGKTKVYFCSRCYKVLGFSENRMA